MPLSVQERNLIKKLIRKRAYTAFGKESLGSGKKQKRMKISWAAVPRSRLDEAMKPNFDRMDDWRSKMYSGPVFHSMFQKLRAQLPESNIFLSRRTGIGKPTIKQYATMSMLAYIAATRQGRFSEGVKTDFSSAEVRRFEDKKRT
jgi:hypothetical protein